MWPRLAAMAFAPSGDDLPRLLQSLSQLVGAGCSVAALDALQERDYLLHLASDDELGDALRVAGATAHELALRHHAVDDFVVYRPRTCSRGFECCHFWVSFQAHGHIIPFLSPLDRQAETQGGEGLVISYAFSKRA